MRPATSSQDTDRLCKKLGALPGVWLLVADIGNAKHWLGSEPVLKVLLSVPNIERPRAAKGHWCWARPSSSRLVPCMSTQATGLGILPRGQLLVTGMRQCPEWSPLWPELVPNVLVGVPIVRSTFLGVAVGQFFAGTVSPKLELETVLRCFIL